MKRESDGRLVLRKRVLRNLDDGTLEAAAGGFDPISIVQTIAETVAQTVATTLTIILSSPCSNVYSKCKTCTA